MTQHAEHKTDAAFPTVTFTVADPRTFDGDPYEVAERAMLQAAGVAQVLLRMLAAADKMARNAEMERAFVAQEEPRGDLWPMTPQGKRLRAITESAAAIHLALKAQATAAGYNPRKVPR